MNYIEFFCSRRTRKTEMKIKQAYTYNNIYSRYKNMTLRIQTRMDLLNAFKYLWSFGFVDISFFPLLPFLPRMGFSNFFNTFWKPDPRRPCRTCDTRGGGGGWATLNGSGIFDRTVVLGSDRLRPRMAWFSWTSKVSLSNWSNRLLCSSPNFFIITDSSSIFWPSLTLNSKLSHVYEEYIYIYIYGSLKGWFCFLPFGFCGFVQVWEAKDEQGREKEQGILNYYNSPFNTTACMETPNAG